MKQTRPPKKPASRDWHPADVKAALEKAGWTCRQLSVHHGFHPVSIQKALRQSWPRAERLVAEAIGKTPQQIWPSRYHRDGTPKRGLHSAKYTKSAVRSPADVQESVA